MPRKCCENTQALKAASDTNEKSDLRHLHLTNLSAYMVSELPIDASHLCNRNVHFQLSVY